MTMVTKTERKIRVKHMKAFGDWLKKHERSQRWAGTELGIYHGYVSNLVTGKQMASEAVCRAAGNLMGPIIGTWNPLTGEITSGECGPPVESAYERCGNRPIAKKSANVPEPAGASPKCRLDRLKRSPTQAELDATVSVVTTWIKSAEPNSLTPSDVVEVTRTLIAGFTSE